MACMPKTTRAKREIHTENAPPEPNLARAFKLVMQLMAIPGKSGEEADVAGFITKALRKTKAPAGALTTDNAHRHTPLGGNTGSLYLRLPGTMKGPRRLLTAHMDTVPICVGSKPVRKGNFVRSANPNSGLGADDRAGATVLLSTALEVLERKLPHPPLVFCWFIQEEVGLYGARLVKKSLLGRPEQAFNWDGSLPHRLVVGATGGYRMTIDVEGQASHAGAAPERGVSAIAIASLAIADLHRGGWHGQIAQNGSQGTSNVGVIHGGEATNVVTDRVSLRAEARSHDPAFRQQIVDEIEASFRRAATEVENVDGQTGRVSFDGQLDYEAFVLPKDEPCVLAAEAAVHSVGRTPERAISNGGLDSNWLFAHGIPSVTLGCGQLNLHMTSEMLDVADFEAACRIALRLATGTE
jgi:tripeptide aminopeptidase